MLDRTGRFNLKQKRLAADRAMGRIVFWAG
jgi:hypothetical protein